MMTRTAAILIGFGATASAVGAAAIVVVLAQQRPADVAAGEACEAGGMRVSVYEVIRGRSAVGIVLRVENTDPARIIRFRGWPDGCTLTDGTNRYRQLWMYPTGERRIDPGQQDVETVQFEAPAAVAGRLTLTLPGCYRFLLPQ
jgi:hypothetical protein